jgi:peroxiredoxin
MEKKLKVGEKAPQFTLSSSTQETVALQSFIGKPVLLAFLRSSG